MPDQTADASSTTSSLAATELREKVAADAQSLAVASIETATIERDAFTATTEEELAAAQAAAQRRVAVAAAQHLGDAFPSYDLSSVVGVARQYIGVPYVFGGSSPAGFDCSGLVKYVYAQFGVHLAHGVSSQARAGVRIPASSAVPGDLVVWSGGGHNGIYSGGGMVIHAPYAGRTVSEQALWGSYYFVRIGG